jgi:hypothetical protein
MNREKSSRVPIIVVAEEIHQASFMYGTLNELKTHPKPIYSEYKQTNKSIFVKLP